MDKCPSALLAALVLFFCRVAAQSIQESVCRVAPVVMEQSVVTIRSRRLASGEWETAITSEEEFLSSSNGTTVDFKRRVIECDGKEIIQMKATITGFRNEQMEKLAFHKKGGKNAVVGKDGRTVRRINEQIDKGYGGVVTNRPLWNDEMFQVRLDARIGRYADSLGIGVTYHNPKNIDYLDSMMCGTIILYDVRLFENGAVTNENYGSNLRNLRVSDRVGVVKKSNGDLRFFVNGVDLGVAKSGIQYPVHGVLDLHGNAVQATLV